MAKFRWGSPCSSSCNATMIRDLPIPGSPERSTTWPSPLVVRRQRRRKKVKFLPTADQRGQRRRVKGLESAFDCARAKDLPRLNRLGETLQAASQERRWTR